MKLRTGVVSGLVALMAVSTVRAQSGCQTDRNVISNQRGIVFESANVAAGQWYWKLVDVAWCEPNPGGFKINIFYKVKDANGSFISNQPCVAAFPYTFPSLPSNQISIMTKAQPDWGDYPMTGGNWCPFWPTGPHGPYSAWVASQCPANGSNCPAQASYPSDRVWGMGLPCNQHESYYLTFQFTQAPPPPQPLIVLSQAAYTRSIITGQHLSSDSFTIQNGGGGTLNFSLSETSNWLSVQPGSGSVSGAASQAISINYDTQFLANGSYVGTITVTGNATNTPQTVTVNLDVHHPRFRGDFDQDGDVDQADFGILQGCLSGEGIYQLQSSCDRAKLDGDQDVDLADFALFLACMNGPDLAPPASCVE